MSSIINIFHIFIVVPLLYALYFYREKLPQWVCYVLMTVSVVGFLYHSDLLFRLPENKQYMNWVYLIHMVLINPLLFYIGYNCRETKRKYFEMILVLMFAALGYHSYNYIKYKVNKI